MIYSTCYFYGINKCLVLISHEFRGLLFCFKWNPARPSYLCPSLISSCSNRHNTRPDDFITRRTFYRVHIILLLFGLRVIRFSHTLKSQAVESTHILLRSSFVTAGGGFLVDQSSGQFISVVSSILCSTVYYFEVIFYKRYFTH